jgi:hypothetical protein
LYEALAEGFGENSVFFMSQSDVELVPLVEKMTGFLILVLRIVN